MSVKLFDELLELLRPVIKKLYEILKVEANSFENYMNFSKNCVKLS